jgi:hypothetical protein
VCRCTQEISRAKLDLLPSESDFISSIRLAQGFEQADHNASSAATQWLFNGVLLLAATT